MLFFGQSSKTADCSARLPGRECLLHRPATPTGRRRIAANIAKLPELVRKLASDFIDGRVELRSGEPCPSAASRRLGTSPKTRRYLGSVLVEKLFASRSASSGLQVSIRDR
jgi:hypothetical protein